MRFRNSILCLVDLRFGPAAEANYVGLWTESYSNDEDGHVRTTLRVAETGNRAKANEAARTHGNALLKHLSPGTSVTIDDEKLPARKNNARSTITIGDEMLIMVVEEPWS